MCRRRCRTIAPPIAIAIALAILAAGFAGAADPATDDKWQFDLALHAWGPTIDGDLRFDIPGFDDSFEIEPGQIIDDLQMAGMLGFQARKNRWSAVADGLELEGWVVQAAGAYDVVRTDRANLGVLIGARYFSLDSDIILRIDGPLPPQLPTREYSRRGDLWDGIVGIKGQYGRKWYMPYYLDLGAGKAMTN